MRQKAKKKQNKTKRRENQMIANASKLTNTNPAKQLTKLSQTHKVEKLFSTGAALNENQCCRIEVKLRRRK